MSDLPEITFPDPPADLFDALRRAARRHPERTLTLIDNRGRAAGRRTFPELLEAARLSARRYQALGLEPGQPVMICLPTSFEWFDAWLGVLFAEGLPLAIAQPGALGSPRTLVEKALRVCSAVDARFLVGSGLVLEEARRALASGFAAEQLEGRLPTELLEADALFATAPATARPDPEPDLHETAFLQLTAGSTGLPRAVEIAHRGAVHNALAVTDSIATVHGSPTGALVAWLPLYHDMGLIGCFLNAVLNGIDLELMSPRTFLARPHVWLERIAQARDVMSPAPNFAYQLCVERLDPERVAALDLSRFRDAMTGSEMVRPETAAAFCERFAAAGFEPGQLRPCYGLAEATLAVTVDQQLRGARTLPVPASSAYTTDLQEVVSTGVPVRDTSVEIRSANGDALGPLELGEVWVRGPGLMNGYYRDPVATRESLRAGWLDTGDLGFVDEGGELYLTGRSKEILILQGQNLMPHELEWIAEGVLASGGSQRCGAFSVPSERGELAVLVIETTERDGERLEQIRHDVGRAIGRALQIPLADLVLVKRGAIPRTSSGKIQRRALRELYLGQKLGRVAGEGR